MHIINFELNNVELFIIHEKRPAKRFSFTIFIFIHVNFYNFSEVREIAKIWITIKY